MQQIFAFIAQRPLLNQILSTFQPTLSQATDLDFLTEAADMPSTRRRYVDMVNPDDLEDLVSLGGSEVTGIIDWDEIDDLIADVH